MMLARQLFCYYARLEKYSCMEIGNFLNFDHVTVSHGSRKVEEMKDTDDIIKNYINKYEIMSRKKQVIEVSPPGYGVDEENDLLKGFMCPKCSGRGYVMAVAVPASFAR